MNCTIPDTGSNTTWTLVVAALVVVVGVAGLLVSRRSSHALALMGLAIVVLGVGAGAGRASAVSAPDCSGLPMCFDLPAEGPDLLLTSTDGIHLEAMSFTSRDGTCTGESQSAGPGAIADTEEEAVAICQADVTNLLATAPDGLTPTPQSNWWGCYSGSDPV